jgi:argininosuccinate lyase
MRRHAPTIDADVFDHLDPARAVDRRDVEGGPARPRVLAAIARIEQELAG